MNPQVMIDPAALMFRNATQDDLETLQSYLPRYAKNAKLAGMDAEFAAITNVDVVERYKGTGSTDFRRGTGPLTNVAITVKRPC